MTVPIIGIDPSVTSTGIAWPDGTTSVIRPAPNTSGFDRLRSIRTQLRKARLLHPPLPRVVVYEKPIEAWGKGGPTVVLRLGEARGVVLEALADDVVYVGIEPARLKRWATGRGNAGKDQMVEALPAGVSVHCDTDDEVDAWWCWHLGHAGVNGVPLDQNDPRFKARLEVLAAIDWPVL